MSLIKKQKKEVLIPLTVRIEEGLLGQLTEYAKYMESSKDYVIAEAIRYIVSRDKEFTERPHQNLHQDPHQNSHQDLNESAAEIRSEVQHRTARASK